LKGREGATGNVGVAVAPKLKEGPLEATEAGLRVGAIAGAVDVLPKLKVGAALVVDGAAPKPNEGAEALGVVVAGAADVAPKLKDGAEVAVAAGAAAAPPKLKAGAAGVAGAAEPKPKPEVPEEGTALVDGAVEPKLNEGAAGVVLVAEVVEAPKPNGGAEGVGTAEFPPNPKVGAVELLAVLPKLNDGVGAVVLAAELAPKLKAGVAPPPDALRTSTEIISHTRIRYKMK